MQYIISIFDTLGVFETFQAITEQNTARSHSLYHFQRLLLDNMHSNAMLENMDIASLYSNGLNDITSIHAFFTQFFEIIEEQLRQNPANYLQNEEVRAEL